jgi:hypothetical protein
MLHIPFLSTGMLCELNTFLVIQLLKTDVTKSYVISSLIIIVHYVINLLINT